MFPGILESHGAVQSGLQLDRDQIDQQLRLQRLVEYFNLTLASASHASQKPPANMAAPIISAAQAVQPPRKRQS